MSTAPVATTSVENLVSSEVMSRLEKLFGRRPTFFRNTECMFNDGIAATVQHLGYEGIITEGVDWLMANWRSPDFVYNAPSGLPVLLRPTRPTRPASAPSAAGATSSSACWRPWAPPSCSG